MTDAGQVARLLAGDREAGDALARTYAGPLKELIRKRLGSGSGSADVDNVYQQVWLNLLDEGCRRLRCYDPSRPLLPFLIGVSLNACRDYLKVEKRRRAGGGDPAAWALLVEDGPSSMETRESMASLMHALERLSPRERMVLEWVALQGLSYAEVGKILEMLPASVSVLASRARERLRVLLGNRESL